VEVLEKKEATPRDIADEIKAKTKKKVSYTTVRQGLFLLSKMGLVEHVGVPHNVRGKDKKQLAKWRLKKP